MDDLNKMVMVAEEWASDTPDARWSIDDTAASNEEGAELAIRLLAVVKAMRRECVSQMNRDDLSRWIHHGRQDAAHRILAAGDMAAGEGE